jgi:hypothetical protein
MIFGHGEVLILSLARGVRSEQPGVSSYLFLSYEPRPRVYGSVLGYKYESV